eukprot:scaffold2246_cov19-Prasinocladus_malaysianus.AAC.2
MQRLRLRRTRQHCLEPSLCHRLQTNTSNFIIKSLQTLQTQEAAWNEIKLQPRKAPIAEGFLRFLLSRRDALMASSKFHSKLLVVHMGIASGCFYWHFAINKVHPHHKASL